MNADPGPSTDLSRPPRPPAVASLSGRLLLLTVGFTMLSAVLIYLPAMSRFRISYLEARVELADQAALALLAAPNGMVSAELEDELLHNVGGKLVAMRRKESNALILSDRQELPMLGKPVDPSTQQWWEGIMNAVMVLISPPNEYVRVLGPSPRDPHTRIEVVLPTAPMSQALRDFSWRVLWVALLISVITGSLVYVSLQLLLVRPIRRLISSIVGFHAAPEDARQIIRPTPRRDELGLAERELQMMQQDLRHALTQRTRLAQLGVAVSKISHDLRNMLAAAQLVSDRLAASDDPTVRQVAPRLVGSIDRAISLAAQTLHFGKAEERAPHACQLALRGFVDDVAAALGLPDGTGIRWHNVVPESLSLQADPDQLYRVMNNLIRNAIQAMPDGGDLRVAATATETDVVIEVADSGGGLSEAARVHLFEPFRGGRSGGTGLGLAISRELIRGHGGDLELIRTGPLGTTFRIVLPQAGG